MSPLVVGQLTVILVGMNRPPPVEALLRTDPHEAANTLASLLTTYPGREKRLEVVIPQAVVPEIKIFHGKSGARHLANPDILVPLLPGTPVLLVHGSTCGYLEGDTTVEHFKDIPVVGKHPFHVLRALAVLHLVIHVEHTQFSTGCMHADIIHAQMEKDTAILATGKRDIHVIKIVKDDLQSPVGGLVDIHLAHHAPPPS